MEADSKWAREMMGYIGEGKPGGDPEGWHSQADRFVIDCIGKLIDDDTADEIRDWFMRGVRWYA